MAQQQSEETNTAATSGVPTAIIGPFQITPAHLFTIASIPFALGGYFGYHSHLKEAAKEESAARTNSQQQQITTKRLSTTQQQLSPKHFVDGRVLAVRALSLATMISVGGFATLGAATFYLFGFRSFEDALVSFRQWGSGVNKKYYNPVFREDHPDFTVTKGMSEQEEWNYIQKTYMPEIDEEIAAAERKGKSSIEEAEVSN